MGSVTLVEVRDPPGAKWPTHLTTVVAPDVGSAARELADFDAQSDLVQRGAEDADGGARLDAALAVLGPPEAALVVPRTTGQCRHGVVADP